MARPRLPRLKYCCICGNEINQPIKIGKGYCLKCKDRVMTEWGTVPFDERVKYLKGTGRLR